MFKDTQVDQQVAKKCLSLKVTNYTLRDVSEETSLIHLTGDVSKICKSVLFEMSLRRCMRRLRNASEMHPCRLGTHSFCKRWSFI